MQIRRRKYDTLLKVNAGLPRKVIKPDYSSRGAMVNVDSELPVEVLCDPDKLRVQARGLFSSLRAALDEELGVRPGPIGGEP